MDEPGSSSTLLNRVESHGQRFPWYLEKLSFVFAIIAAIFAGQWMWNDSDWEAYILWPMTLCGLPLIAMFGAESISRVIQAIHKRGAK